MRKFFLFFLPLILILSCDTVTEESLYDENDPEYEFLQALDALQCVNDSSIFAALDNAGNFESTGHLNKIYKINQDANDAVVLYVKVISVSSTLMQMVVNSAVSEYQKIINFEKTDHDALLDVFEQAACNTKYEEFFSASGLDDTDTLNLTWSKETIDTVDNNDADDDPESYYRQTDAYKVDRDFPLFFYYWNATKTTNILINNDTSDNDGTTEDTDKETEKPSVITITDVTEEDECEEGNSSQSTGCQFLTTDYQSFVECDVTIDSDAYDTNTFENEFILLSTASGSSGTCTLLESGD